MLWEDYLCPDMGRPRVCIFCSLMLLLARELRCPHCKGSGSCKNGEATSVDRLCTGVVLLCGLHPKQSNYAHSWLVDWCCSNRLHMRFKVFPLYRIHLTVMAWQPNLKRIHPSTANVLPSDENSMLALSPMRTDALRSFITTASWQRLLQSRCC